MIDINLNIKDGLLDVYEFNDLISVLVKLNYRFDMKVEVGYRIKIKGDLALLSPIAEKCYKKWVKKGIICNLRVISNYGVVEDADN